MTENIPKYIGNKIKHYRKTMGMTQEELGTKLNTTKSRISNYETGYRTPKQDDLFELASILNIRIDDLFPTKNNENKSNTLNEIIKLSSKLKTERQERALDFIKYQYNEQQNESIDNEVMSNNE
ncbi:helix-turn-helix domain-containing protein [Staphylococcus xylosus]